MENPGPIGTDRLVRNNWITAYRRISLGLAIVFAGTGLLFLFIPGTVLLLFNELSISFGLQSSPVEGINFYLILAVGYMYIVTMLAWLMYREPENRSFPVLLMNAKTASSVLSFVFFFAVSHALIYLVNGIVDGLIAAGVILMYKMQKRTI
jgi:hypothetical protein